MVVAETAEPLSPVIFMPTPLVMAMPPEPPVARMPVVAPSIVLVPVTPLAPALMDKRPPDAMPSMPGPPAVAVTSAVLTVTASPPPVPLLAA